jgi:predicted cupin superfamily sugar epimerase
LTEAFTGEEAADFSWVALSAAGRAALGGLPPRAAEVAEALGLEPHREGGYFRETYRSPLTIHTEFGVRSLATAIVYLLIGSDPSRFHRLRADEIWFFHAGSRAEMVMLLRAAGG